MVNRKNDARKQYNKLLLEHSETSYIMEPTNAETGGETTGRNFENQQVRLTPGPLHIVTIQTTRALGEGGGIVGMFYTSVANPKFLVLDAPALSKVVSFIQMTHALKRTDPHVT